MSDEYKDLTNNDLVSQRRKINRELLKRKRIKEGEKEMEKRFFF